MGGQDKIDFTAIQGSIGAIEIDENLQFPTEQFTPVLLALAHNKLEIAQYFLEEVGLSLPLYMFRPRDQQDLQLTHHLQRHPEDKKDYGRVKKK